VPRAQVVVLAGPSGAGKSRLAERLGLPVLRLDDFYKDGDDPSLPRIVEGANSGLVDWDHPDSWHREDALTALRELCAAGSSVVPVYEIAQNGRCGVRTVDLEGSDLFVAEGIFAPEVVSACREEGLLAAAYCITQHPAVTFWRRLTRDLREHRKPPVVLLRRGLALMRAQQRVVAHAVRQGCRRATGDQAYVELTAARARS
jgi:uridine kinase